MNTFIPTRVEVIPERNHLIISERHTVRLLLEGSVDTSSVLVYLDDPESRRLYLKNESIYIETEPSNVWEDTIEGTVEVSTSGRTYKLPFNHKVKFYRPELLVNVQTNNFLLINEENRINISVPGVEAEDLIVNTNHGELRFIRPGYYTLKPETKDSLTVNVSRKWGENGNWPVGSYELRVVDRDQKIGDLISRK